MKKIMFNNRYGLTRAVADGRKTKARRIAPDNTPIGCWKETEAKAHFKVGEIVAVAQRYQELGFDPAAPLMEADGVGGFRRTDLSPGWTNKMFVRADLMPLKICITDVQFERLQDISDDDCIKEGIEWDGKAQSFYVNHNQTNNSRIWLGKTPREAFAALIDRISGKGTWERNPYVFVYEFERVK